jgi:anti-anti-sigma factor
MLATGDALQAGEAALRLVPVDRFEHVMFIEVEGELREPSDKRWSALLRAAVDQRAEGIAVDLRGCRGIDAHSLQHLLAAASTLKARGGSGVALVLYPGSALAQRLRLLGGDELPICDSTRAAMGLLGKRRMPPPPLVRVEREGGLAIIAVIGEFDLAGEPEFSLALEDALALEAPLLVDLEHCQFIDSTGIALLVRSSELAGDRGFALAASGPQVHRVLELVGIPEQLPTYRTRNEAIRALLA